MNGRRIITLALALLDVVLVAHVLTTLAHL